MKIFVLIFLINFNVYANYNEKVPGFYLKHFSKVKDLKDNSCRKFNDRVYRGGQPIFDNSDIWILTLLTHSIKYVFDFRSENGNSIKERDILLSNRIVYIKVPLETDKKIPKKIKIEIGLPYKDITKKPIIFESSLERVKAINLILDFMNQAILESNIYIHCQRGEDRTGIMIALMRDCYDSKEWRKEFNEYGGTMYKPLKEIFEEINSNK
jgi:hypothetical protein